MKLFLFSPCLAHSFEQEASGIAHQPTTTPLFVRPPFFYRGTNAAPGTSANPYNPIGPPLCDHDEDLQSLSASFHLSSQVRQKTNQKPSTLNFFLHSPLLSPAHTNYPHTSPSCLVNDPSAALPRALPLLLPRLPSSTVPPPRWQLLHTTPLHRPQLLLPFLRAPVCSARLPALLRKLYPFHFFIVGSSRPCCVCWDKVVCKPALSGVILKSKPMKCNTSLYNSMKQHAPD